MAGQEAGVLPWYSEDGECSDTIVSSRVRLARNLANFPFPAYFKSDDFLRVQALVFDAFGDRSKDSSFGYHVIDCRVLDENGRRILEERGVLKTQSELQTRALGSESGLVMSKDGRIACALNSGDHVRLSYFSTGLSVRRAHFECARVDSALQDKLQFVSTADFGYLTAYFCDAGSGMKISARIHIPSVLRAGRVSSLSDALAKSGLSLSPLYQFSAQMNPAPAFFTVATTSAAGGTEIDQIASFEAACRFIIETENKIAADFADYKSVVVRNAIIRAYSAAKTSLLISYPESLSMISDLKFGKKIGYLQGIDDNAFCGLLYRVQDGHLTYLMNNGNFTFENDLATNIQLKLDRLRAIIMQETLSNVALRNI
ncbi:MAG: hypothetical protein ACTTKL_00095 [Treponema sp.]